MYDSVIIIVETPMADSQRMRELLDEAKEGNSEAFGELYEFYVTPIFRYIFVRVKDKDIAEDLTQTVFLKVFRNLHAIENRFPRAYLYTVAKNILTDFWRKNNTKEFPIEMAERVASPVLVDEAVGERMDHETKMQSIRDSLSILSDDQREVILLKFIQDLSTEEIAAALDKNEEAVRQTQCRALKALRAHLKTKKIV